MSDRTKRLVALRARTDHDLRILVDRELDRGFTFLKRAATRNSPPFTQAEKALAMATEWSSRLPELDPLEQRCIELRLNELRSALAQVPVYANLSPYQTSAAS